MVNTNNAYCIVGTDCENQNQLDTICAEHSLEIAWYGVKQFVWSCGSQFGRETSEWVEISNWTQRQLYDWLGY